MTVCTSKRVRRASARRGRRRLTVRRGGADGKRRTARRGSAVATFAGGCFWCMEPPFDKLPGVISTTSGYIGGTKKQSDLRGSLRAARPATPRPCRCVYDPTKVTYEKLLDVFWHNIDPTVKDRQFCDIGSQYRTGDLRARRRAAEARPRRRRRRSRRRKPFKEPIVTPIVDATEFWPAEEYHQDYYGRIPSATTTTAPAADAIAA